MKELETFVMHGDFEVTVKILTSGFRCGDNCPFLCWDELDASCGFSKEDLDSPAGISQRNQKCIAAGFKAENRATNERYRELAKLDTPEQREVNDG